MLACGSFLAFGSILALAILAMLALAAREREYAWVGGVVPLGRPVCRQVYRHHAVLCS